jgi:excisionase family DNA binding protein
LTDAFSAYPVFSRPADPDLIPLSEVAAMLGVRRDTVKRWCEEGRLSAVKHGFRWWVRQDELQGTLLDRLMRVEDGDAESVVGPDGRALSESTLRGKPGLVGGATKMDSME